MKLNVAWNRGEQEAILSAIRVSRSHLKRYMSEWLLDIVSEKVSMNRPLDSMETIIVVRALRKHAQLHIAHRKGHHAEELHRLANEIEKVRMEFQLNFLKKKKAQAAPTAYAN